MNTSDARIGWLIAAVKDLGRDAGHQVQLLEQGGASADIDELALAFDDAYRPLVSELRTSSLSHDVVRKLEELNVHLDTMSGAEHSALWTKDALSEASQWIQVRALADDLVRALEGRTLDDGERDV